MDELKTDLVPLSDATLDQLPAGIERPRYDRRGLTPGIVHIGLGNFHRAHQAWYLHRLMQQGDAQDWAILGAGVRPYDAAMREKLLAQDCLTTLIELAPESRSAEITGSMIDYLPIEEDNAALIRSMSDPAIRIVALTVTEGGHYIDPGSGGLDSNHPDIRHDVAHPDNPRTAFGAMVAALRHRRAQSARPFSGLSCDNLTSNGDILRHTIVGLARLSDPDLADWIDTEGAFPNSMVDCIVPATGPQELALVQSFGLADVAPVVHEDFRQWVLEDTFCNGRPNWDAVGATFTNDVHAYEAMKIRILNAGHQVLANVGELLSLTTIADCMAHKTVAAFFHKVQSEEILPYVAPVPGTTPSQYLELIERRFANPAIRDTTRRVAFDGSARHSGFVLPVLRDAIAANGSIEGLALVEALWAKMCAGSRDDGTQIEPNDPHWAALQATATAAQNHPIKWLEQSAIYGELNAAPQFEAAFANWLNILSREGAIGTLKAYLND
ncbi:mannitol dehydrogenase family protein [Rhodophyticola sp. CCM32]|uniref:mannitol dehydrogenase family protein n=1 Tax=Rhodophyticola sp. CCM32 TaxID=2916397 RepID=UPI00107F5A39|nr:mannitol dehydrogenase family protein [Rhodophyticola sp. CCM32]QBX99529.1 mannitol dehydrogenase family protein [Rhodophyticola sp. CCM32]